MDMHTTTLLAISTSSYDAWMHVCICICICILRVVLDYSRGSMHKVHLGQNIMDIRSVILRERIMNTLCIHTTAGSTYAYNIIILQYSIRIL